MQTKERVEPDIPPKPDLAEIPLPAQRVSFSRRRRARLWVSELLNVNAIVSSDYFYVVQRCTWVPTVPMLPLVPTPQYWRWRSKADQFQHF